MSGNFLLDLTHADLTFVMLSFSVFLLKSVGFCSDAVLFVISLILKSLAFKLQ